MKRKIISIILASTLIFSTSILAMASNNSNNIVDTEYFDNGYYTETIITEIDDGSKASKSGTKRTSYYNNGTLLWYVQVNGSFTYNGSSSTCTSSTVTAASNNSAWKISSKSASKTGNIAKATATAKQYILGVCIQTITRNVSLTCNNNGVLS